MLNLLVFEMWNICTLNNLTSTSFFLKSSEQLHYHLQKMESVEADQHSICLMTSSVGTNRHYTSTYSQNRHLATSYPALIRVTI